MCVKSTKAVGAWTRLFGWGVRSQLIDLALEGHSWIRQDKWDGKTQPEFQECFAAQASLACHLDAWAAQMGQTRKIRVLAEFGADLVNKCHIFYFYVSPVVM
jgi:hypothetical protein